MNQMIDCDMIVAECDSESSITNSRWVSGTLRMCVQYFTDNCSIAVIFQLVKAGLRPINIHVVMMMM